MMMQSFHNSDFDALPSGLKIRGRKAEMDQKEGIGFYKFRRENDGFILVFLIDVLCILLL